MIFCTNCGNQVTGRFCPNCGQDCDPQQGEKIEETLKKLYTLRAGISVISDKCDSAEKSKNEISKKIKDAEGKRDEAMYTVSAIENWKHRVKKKMKVDGFETEEEFNLLKGKYATKQFIYIIFGLVMILVGIVLFFGCFPIGIDLIGSGWASFASAALGIGLAFGGYAMLDFQDVGLPDCYMPGDHYNKIDPFSLNENKAKIATFEGELSNLKNSLEEGVAFNERIGSSLYNSLKDQFAEFLSPVDWENIDLMIFYFESGRAVNMREALQLVDRQRQTDSIIEAINNATEKICHTINRGIMYINETIVNCASILSSQLSAISAQQTQLLISADSMQRALRNKSNESSRQLMDDVHKICHYTEAAAIEKRNR